MPINQAPNPCESEIFCDSCQQNNNDGREIPKATQYCIDCEEYHCSKCNKYHAKLKATRHHKNKIIEGNLKFRRKVLDAETLRFHMECQRSKLIEIIDSEFGFLDHLLSDGVIPYSDLESIRATKTRSKKNERLLDYIFSNDKHENLMTALSQYSQSHVANWITGNGNYREEFGRDWPLLDDEHAILDRNQSSLVNAIDPCELVDKLYSVGAISICQRNYITSKRTDYERNVALLDIIRRSSLNTYVKLKKCLQETNQTHISEILEAGGVIVPVHAKLESDNLNEAETQIVNRIMEILHPNTISEQQMNRVLVQLRLNLITVKRGGSIVLYIGCCKNEELDHLCKVVENVGTKEILERLFSFCADKQTVKVCDVKVFEEDLVKAWNTFAEEKRNKRIRDRVVDMYKEFVSEVDPKNIFGLLIQKRIISIEQKQKITNKVTTKDRCQALLNHLFVSSQKKSFIILRDSLEDHYPSIVQRIDQCEPDHEATHILDTKCHQSMKTQSEQQEHPEDPLHTNLLSDVEERRKTNFQSLKRIFESRDKNFAQNLGKSRTETVEIKDQHRFPKQDLDKGLARERNLNKELDAFKTRTAAETLDKGIFGSVREVPNRPTTLDIKEPHRNPSAFSSKSAKLFKSCVFVIGIDDGFSTTKDVLKINLNQTEEVSNIQQMPVDEVWESAAAVYCQSLFVTGIGGNRDEIWKLDATSYTWMTCASLVVGRQCHSVAFVDHILYICGGWVSSTNKALDGVEAYDTLTDNCTTVGKLAFAFYNSGNCVRFKSSLYIFGGKDANGKIVNTVQVYDTKLNTCTLLSKPMPITPCHLRAVLWKNTAILLGYDCCLKFNLVTEEWKVRDRFKTNAACFGLSISNGLVFVFGGGRLTADADGNEKWICRDDVRCIPVENILNDTPIVWRHHATLPKPSMVYAFGRMEFGFK